MNGPNRPGAARSERRHRCCLALSWLAVLAPLLAITLLGCGRPRARAEVLPTTVSSPQPRATHAPIQFPRDEAPHDVLTEWWYYTGHLDAADGRRFGFEYVIFQTVRGDYPVIYLGQFAITDPERTTFQHASRLSQGSQLGPTDQLDLTVQDWHMRGALGRAELQASMDNYALSLSLQTRKPAALHDHDGLVSFGPAGDSYYYSYTRLDLTGTLSDHGTPLAVTGQAWFDHQWGDFLVLGGGWDWFSLQLDDGSELMLNYLRDERDSVVGVWGSYVDPVGAVRVLGQNDFRIVPTATWTSAASGGTYPMGWRITLGELGYELEMVPLLQDQELVSEGSGPTYWEGAADVHGTRNGQPVSGRGYAELTGYARK
jgi:predicted secreted hydrolase